MRVFVPDPRAPRCPLCGADVAEPDDFHPPVRRLGGLDGVLLCADEDRSHARDRAVRGEVSVRRLRSGFLEVEGFLQAYGHIDTGWAIAGPTVFVVGAFGWEPARMVPLRWGPLPGQHLGAARIEPTIVGPAFRARIPPPSPVLPNERATAIHALFDLLEHPRLVAAGFLRHLSMQPVRQAVVEETGVRYITEARILEVGLSPAPAEPSTPSSTPAEP